MRPCLRNKDPASLELQLSLLNMETKHIIFYNGAVIPLRNLWLVDLTTTDYNLERTE